ncbi:LuxR C-terminal-related transcriptional regulator [Escherichia coli]|uniref:LuxR C-terminal-related transcriptional regulator n=1 Tax=Escherichia coli TaxID=562 RepID=UPI00333D6ABF
MIQDRGSMEKLTENNLLSLRERQVLHMLTQGYEYAQISQNINISVSCQKYQA